MKVKVIKKFRDKYTKEIYQQGDIIEVTKKRFNEINSKSLFVEEVAEKKGQDGAAQEDKQEEDNE